MQRARDITADMIDTFKADEVDEVYLIYTKIQNALTAEPVMLQLLPLERSPLCAAAARTGRSPWRG